MKRNQRIQVGIPGKRPRRGHNQEADCSSGQNPPCSRQASSNQQQNPAEFDTVGKLDTWLSESRQRHYRHAEYGLRNEPAGIDAELAQNQRSYYRKGHAQGLRRIQGRQLQGIHRNLQQNKLPEHQDTGTGLTQEQFNKMGYQSRLKLYQEQPDVYAKMTGKE